MILLCAYFGINFLKGKDLLSSKNTYYALYDDVSGLKTSSSVIIRGVKVGIVNDIEFAGGDSGKVRVALNIARSYKIPDNSCARLFSDGIMGGRAIEIEIGDSPQMLKNRQYIETRTSADLMASLGDGAGDLIGQLSEAVDNISKTVRSINDMVEQNKGSVSAAMDNLQSITRRLDAILSSQEDNISEIIEGIGSFSNNLKNNSERFDAIIANVESISDSLKTAQLREVVDNLASTVAEANITLQKLNDGDGSAARLLNDAELYNSLSQSADNLAALLEDIKAHPSRYVNITVFGRRDKNKNNQ